MELCIKTCIRLIRGNSAKRVSILVLMELCIKTLLAPVNALSLGSFNPCFNGTMYKNSESSSGSGTISWFQSLF